MNDFTESVGAPQGLLVPLGGVATDPDGVNYAVASIDGDNVELRCWRGEESATVVRAVKGVPVRIGEQDVLISAVLTEEGKRPWVVLGPA
ncbi:hypothetical protein [Alloactinosynnema sp. L-07]|uniref:hypothetical protein n=1 Tax=Alloactinosynnema sp. L-07 TaxID=1653480 RepID=UPI00065F04A7|nr:hypothetical protein [Alloactinosynnema sp. L-07]CRK56486.1 hypothetical protein [Alloactinosynnema sp. L-07]